MVADELARRARVNFSSPKGVRADVAETRISAGGLGVPGVDAVRVVLVKPRTFMNESGQAISKLASFHKIDPEHIVAIHDELDVDFGRMRIKFGGGDNGHNGLKSMRQHLGTGDFLRVRFGIGRPPGRQEAADYVLAPIPASLREDYAVEAARVADATEYLLLQGLVEAQNRYNA